MADDDTYECEHCGKTFDTSRGMKVHAAQVHKETEEKKEELVLLELINEGKRSLNEMKDELNWEDSRIKERLDDLMEKDYISENVKSGKKTFYEITERGQEEIPALVEDVVEETQSFVKGVRSSFEKHIGPLLPRIDVEWPRKKKED
ncbi:MAG: winged helix DNA-binding protein [Candidatus Nanohaloarchaea archaeon]|nr:winged helix DNA-binding protein [Candidatus Nanohaloarchaea archaeon]